MVYRSPDRFHLRLRDEWLLDLKGKDYLLSKREDLSLNGKDSN